MEINFWIFNHVGLPRRLMRGLCGDKRKTTRMQRRCVIVLLALIVLSACSGSSGGVLSDDDLSREQVKLLHVEIQKLIQHVSKLEEQSKSHQLLLGEMRHQIDEQLLPAALQISQQNLKIRKQDSEFRRLQRNLRVLSIVS